MATFRHDSYSGENRGGPVREVLHLYGRRYRLVFDANGDGHGIHGARALRRGHGFGADVDEAGDAFGLIDAEGNGEKLGVVAGPAGERRGAWPLGDRGMRRVRSLPAPQGLRRAGARPTLALIP